MLDRAKILLSFSNDFSDICKKASPISTISAMKFLDPIEIMEMMAIK